MNGFYELWTIQMIKVILKHEWLVTKTYCKESGWRHLHLSNKLQLGIFVINITCYWCNHEPPFSIHQDNWSKISMLLLSPPHSLPFFPNVLMIAISVSDMLRLMACHWHANANFSLCATFCVLSWTKCIYSGNCDTDTQNIV